MDFNKVFIEISDETGEVFTLNAPDSFWRILSDGLEGADYPNTTIHSQLLANTQGSIITGRHLDSREIEITAISNNSDKVRRAETIDFFDPLKDYEISIKYGTRTVKTKAVLEGFSLPSANVFKRMRLTLKFFCEDPYFLQSNSCSSTEVLPHGFAMPFTGSGFYGSAFGVLKDDPTVFTVRAQTATEQVYPTFTVRVKPQATLGDITVETYKYGYTTGVTLPAAQVKAGYIYTFNSKDFTVKDQYDGNYTARLASPDWYSLIVYKGETQDFKIVTPDKDDYEVTVTWDNKILGL